MKKLEMFLGPLDGLKFADDATFDATVSFEYKYKGIDLYELMETPSIDPNTAVFYETYDRTARRTKGVYDEVKKKRMGKGHIVFLHNQGKSKPPRKDEHV